MHGSLVLVATGLVACSPYGGGAFHCAADADCVDSARAGRCELAVGFCSFDDDNCASGHRFGGASGDVANQCVDSVDASVVPPDAPAVACFGTSALAIVCPTTPLATPLSIGGTITIDTSPGSADCLATTATSTAACVIGGTTVDIFGTLRAIGARPLVIVATTTISVGGTIDVASHRVPAESIGANASACVGTQPPTGGGGGAGGTSATTGGSGGANGSGNGGIASAPPSTLAFVGGCIGEAGSLATTGTPGLPGHGGGAVYLAARTSISIAGTIDASGEGGTSGLASTPSGGGGGGGGGGVVVLDAPRVTLTASGTVFANGGGGGEGNSGNGAAGATGADPSTWNAAPFTPGTSSSGGDGGTGAYTTHGASAGGGGAAGGGGGGGGGAGAVKIVATTKQLAGNTSPPAQ